MKTLLTCNKCLLSVFTYNNSMPEHICKPTKQPVIKKPLYLVVKQRIFKSLAKKETRVLTKPLITYWNDILYNKVYDSARVVNGTTREEMYFSIKKIMRIKNEYYEIVLGEEI